MSKYDKLPKLQVRTKGKPHTESFAIITDIATDGGEVYEEIQTQKRAEAIVHRCNMHDDLLVACETKDKLLQDIGFRKKYVENHDELLQTIKDLFIEIKNLAMCRRNISMQSFQDYPKIVKLKRLVENE